MQLAGPSSSCSAHGGSALLNLAWYWNERHTLRLTPRTSLKLARFAVLADILLKKIPVNTSQHTAKASAVWLSKHIANPQGPKGKMANSQDGQSYLAKLSPWGGRSPAMKAAPFSDSDAASGDLGLKQTKGRDHKVTHRHRLSLRNYPRDCPPLITQWFFATDVPKRRPNPLEVPGKEPKNRPAPRKYAPFSKTDSKAIETAFQKLAEEEDAAEREDDNATRSTHSSKTYDEQYNTTLNADDHCLQPGSVTVPVNEDYLFDVDVERRELAPAYWLGPVYEVRRGTWFYQGKHNWFPSCLRVRVVLQAAP